MGHAQGHEDWTPKSASLLNAAPAVPRLPIDCSRSPSVYRFAARAVVLRPDSKQATICGNRGDSWGFRARPELPRMMLEFAPMLKTAHAEAVRGVLPEVTNLRQGNGQEWRLLAGQRCAARPLRPMRMIEESNRENCSCQRHGDEGVKRDNQPHSMSLHEFVALRNVVRRPNLVLYFVLQILNEMGHLLPDAAMRVRTLHSQFLLYGMAAGQACHSATS